MQPPSAWTRVARGHPIGRGGAKPPQRWLTLPLGVAGYPPPLKGWLSFSFSLLFIFNCLILRYYI
jgi:hypothetical protein